MVVTTILLYRLPLPEPLSFGPSQDAAGLTKCVTLPAFTLTMPILHWSSLHTSQGTKDVLLFSIRTVTTSQC